ncbi:hypothetical protein ACIQAC_18310 [Streptomyces sp. NPDC088387]
MRTMTLACRRFLRDVYYGVDTGHAIRLGRRPAPQPARRKG